MTAWQDWLNIRPSLDPRAHVKTFICALLRGFSAADSREAAEPVLIRPGVERC